MKTLLKPFVIVGVVTALLLCMTACGPQPKRAMPTVTFPSTTQTTTVTEPPTTTTTAPTAPTADANGTMYRDVEPYLLAVGNPEKSCYDAPRGNYIGSFGAVGYYSVVQEAVDTDDYIWCQLGDGRWTYVYQEALPPITLHFSSGVGGWGTVLYLNGDGKFSGEYHDSDMGASGPDYPNGTYYECDFSGSFHITDISSNAVTLKLASLSKSHTAGDQWIEDGVLHIATEPYGLSGSQQFILFIPSTPVNELPSDARSWSNGAIPSYGTLGCYALYNTAEGTTFFTY